MRRIGVVILAGASFALSAQAKPMPHPTAKGFVQYFFSGVQAQNEVQTISRKKKSAISEDEIFDFLKKKMKKVNVRKIKRISRLIIRLAKKFDMHPGLILSVMKVESGFEPWAVSPKGALGLMQIMPETGRWLCPQTGMRWKGSGMLFEPITNITLGVYYLDMLRKTFKGDPIKILAAYNWGPGNVQKNLRRGRGLPTEYYVKVRQNLENYAFGLL